MQASEFLALGNARLMEILLDGHAIDPGALDDSEYKGVALGLPRFVEKLTWKTFKKTFHRDPDSGVLRGWNVRLEQDGLEAPCRPMTKRGEIFSFGHYHVVPAEGRRMPKPAQRGVLIDYGVGGNARLDALSLMRDPLVAVNAGSVELLLGWSYAEIGPFTFGTPSFFTLERDGALSHQARPPRA